MKSMLLVCGGMLALSLGGCASSDRAATDDTAVAPTGISPLWETDWQATLELVQAAEPEEPEYFTLRNIAREEGVYDVILELNPDGEFIMSLRMSDEPFEASGWYRVYDGESGTLVRLLPSAPDNERMLQLNPIIRSLVIRVDPSGERAVMQSLSEFSTVLRGMN